MTKPFAVTGHSLCSKGGQFSEDPPEIKAQQPEPERIPRPVVFFFILSAFLCDRPYKGTSPEPGPDEWAPGSRWEGLVIRAADGTGSYRGARVRTRHLEHRTGRKRYRRGRVFFLVSLLLRR
ncbi:hypothetical protein GWI33_020152 [Rhynchophorus ferrugineus]|uniref:Uncharacterized protein n=1 Tax=Rhynchophorus ferrugineus TaxID=354439 RepID=A0A834HSZ1_RHYFE|nr:hypothetical protein GWI33_020152 [Rhynchophorus ferrugineus]